MTSTALARISEIEEYLTDPANMVRISDVAAEQITPSRLVRVGLQAIQDGDKLHECTPESILLALMNAAAVGLEPLGPLGDGYLIKYGSTCVFQTGYKGLIKLIKWGGDVAKVEAREVCEHDLIWDYEYGINPDLKHKPTLEARGELTDVYAIAWLPGGFTQFEVMSSEQVEEVRACSKAPNSPAWRNFYAMMARKCAVRRLSNYLELSTEARTAIAIDDLAAIGEQVDVTSPITDMTALKASQGNAEALRGRLAATVSQPEDDAPEGAFRFDGKQLPEGYTISAGSTGWWIIEHMGESIRKEQWRKGEVVAGIEGHQQYVESVNLKKDMAALLDEHGRPTEVLAWFAVTMFDEREAIVKTADGSRVDMSQLSIGHIRELHQGVSQAAEEWAAGGTILLINPETGMGEQV